MFLAYMLIHENTTELMKEVEALQDVMDPRIQLELLDAAICSKCAEFKGKLFPIIFKEAKTP